LSGSICINPFGPLFANVNIQFTSTSGNYVQTEWVYAYTAAQFNANATVGFGNNLISCNTANLLNQVANGQNILLSGGGQSQLAQVISIQNSSFLTINSTALFTCTQSLMSSIILTGNAMVTNVNSTNSIYVTNCTGVAFQTGANVIGGTSGTTGVLSSVVRNGVNEFFPTFQQLYKYNATSLSGTFTLNEQVNQGNNTAYLYGVTGSLVLYLGDFTGNVFSTGVITGQTSGAQANITSGYVPDLVIGSGNILYLENIAAVTRSNNQTEQFNVVMNF